jgi:hypothetical protein
MNPNFSQRDSRWSSQYLGDSQLTIGKVGCLLTCAAAVLADCGVGTDPRRLNCWLVTNHGYKDDNLFIWKSIEPFGVKVLKVVSCQRVPAPVLDIAAYRQNGKHVILEVDWQPGGTIQQHWVRLLDPVDWRIHDPWQLPGQTEQPLSIYFAPGWDAARAIMAFGVYEPVQTKGAIYHAESAEEVQEQLCIRPRGQP